MSAPHTNLDKQRRRHRAPMIGMAAALLFVALLALAALIWPGIPLDGQAAPDGEPRPAAEDGLPADSR